jgi:hypothetical protein
MALSCFLQWAYLCETCEPARILLDTDRCFATGQLSNETQKKQKKRLRTALEKAIHLFLIADRLQSNDKEYCPLSILFEIPERKKYGGFG